MSAKKKQRHHELKDRANVETRWIEKAPHAKPDATTQQTTAVKIQEKQKDQ